MGFLLQRRPFNPGELTLPMGIFEPRCWQSGCQECQIVRSLIGLYSSDPTRDEIWDEARCANPIRPGQIMLEISHDLGDVVISTCCIKVYAYAADRVMHASTCRCPADSRRPLDSRLDQNAISVVLWGTFEAVFSSGLVFVDEFYREVICRHSIHSGLA